MAICSKGLSIKGRMTILLYNDLNGTLGTEVCSNLPHLLYTDLGAVQLANPCQRLQTHVTFLQDKPAFLFLPSKLAELDVPNLLCVPNNPKQIYNRTFRMSPLICISFLPFVFCIVSDVTEVQICRLRWGFFEAGDASTRSTTPGATSRWGSRGESMVKPEISPSHEVDIFWTSSNRWSNEHSVSFTNSVVFGGLHPCLAKVFCSPVLHTWVVILPSTCSCFNWIKIDISEAYTK